MQQEFHHEGFMVDVDLNPGDTLNKKIRAAQLSQYNYILGKQIGAVKMKRLNLRA